MSSFLLNPYIEYGKTYVGYIGAISSTANTYLRANYVSSSGYHYVGGTTYNAQANTSILMRVYDSNGAITMQYTSPVISSTYYLDSIAVDSSGNIYLAGRRAFSTSYYVFLYKLPPNFNGTNFIYQKVYSLVGQTPSSSLPGSILSYPVKLVLDSTGAYATLMYTTSLPTTFVLRIDTSTGNILNGYQMRSGIFNSNQISGAGLVSSLYSATLDTVYILLSGQGGTPIDGTLYTNILYLASVSGTTSLTIGTTTLGYVSGQHSYQLNPYGISVDNNNGKIIIGGMYQVSTSLIYGLNVIYTPTSSTGFSFTSAQYTGVSTLNKSTWYKGVSIGGDSNAYLVGFDENNSAAVIHRWSESGIINLEGRITGSNWASGEFGNSTLPIFYNTTADSNYVYAVGSFDYPTAGNFARGLIARIPTTPNFTSKTGTYSPANAAFGTTSTTVSFTAPTAGSTTAISYSQMTAGISATSTAGFLTNTVSETWTITSYTESIYKF